MRPLGYWNGPKKPSVLKSLLACFVSIRSLRTFCPRVRVSKRSRPNPGCMRLHDVNSAWRQVGVKAGDLHLKFLAKVPLRRQHDFPHDAIREEKSVAARRRVSASELSMSIEVNMDSDPYRYAAFISYRHGGEDERLAKWLHSRIERFRVPRSLVRLGLPRQIGRVFLDCEELPASANLSVLISDSLEQSRHLIVVSSPRTPQSRWVEAEVQAFIASGRRSKILVALSSGEPSDSFPKSLFVPDALDGMPPPEPLAADFRRGRGSRSQSDELLRIIACLLGCTFDDLRQREERRKKQRIVGFSIFALGLVCTLTFFGWRWMSASADAVGERSRRAQTTSLLFSQGSAYPNVSGKISDGEIARIEKYCRSLMSHSSAIDRVEAGTAIAVALWSAFGFDAERRFDAGFLAEAAGFVKLHCGNGSPESASVAILRVDSLLASGKQSEAGALIDAEDVGVIIDSLRSSGSWFWIANSLARVASKSDRPSLARGLAREMRLFALRQPFPLSSTVVPKAVAVATELQMQGDYEAASEIVDWVYTWYPKGLSPPSRVDFELAIAGAKCAANAGNLVEFERHAAFAEEQLRSLGQTDSLSFFVLLQLRVAFDFSRGDANRACKQQESLVNIAKKLDSISCAVRITELLRLAFLQCCIGDPDRAFASIRQLRALIAQCPVPDDGALRERNLLYSDSLFALALMLKGKPIDALSNAKSIPDRCDRLGTGACDCAVLALITMSRSELLMGNSDAALRNIEDARKRLPECAAANQYLSSWISQVEIEVGPQPVP